MNIHQMLHQTARSADLPLMSDEACCQLLAWTYAYAGQYEAVVKNLRLNADIEAARLQLGIEAGSTPNAKAYQLLRSYLRQVSVGPTDQHPEWCQKINQKYNLPKLH